MHYQPHIPPKHSPEAMRSNRRRKLSRDARLLQDNLLAHANHYSTALTQQFAYEIIPHHSYCPDLARSDFFLFPKMKNVVRGRGFSTRRTWLLHMRCRSRPRHRTLSLPCRCGSRPRHRTRPLHWRRGHRARQMSSTIRTSEREEMGEVRRCAR